jgi:Uma2 family endonuclease
MALEMLSPGTKALDLSTKRENYERLGINEYWIIDPAKETFTILRWKDGEYEDVTPRGTKLRSLAIPGFTLDLAAVKRVLKG